MKFTENFSGNQGHDTQQDHHEERAEHLQQPFNAWMQLLAHAGNWPAPPCFRFPCCIILPLDFLHQLQPFPCSHHSALLYSIPGLLCIPLANNHRLFLVAPIVVLVDVCPRIRKRLEKVKAIIDPDSLFIFHDDVATMHIHAVNDLLHLLSVSFDVHKHIIDRPSAIKPNEFKPIAINLDIFLMMCIFPYPALDAVVPISVMLRDVRKLIRLRHV